MKSIKEIIETLFYDIECLELKDTKSNKYHYGLIKGNLKLVRKLLELEK